MKLKPSFLFILLFLPSLASAAYVVKPFYTPSGFLVWAIQIVEIDKVHAAELSLKEQVKNYILIMSDLIGVNGDLMVKIGSCESWDYKEDVINNIQLGDNGASMGVFQWQARSWQYYNKKFGLNLDRTKWRDQARLTTLVARDYGTARDWVNCTRYAKTGVYKN